MNSKPSIAIIIPGGIGTGLNNIGVPVLENLVKLLAPDFRITVFSLFRINENYTANGFELVGIPSSNPMKRAIDLFLLFNRHHKLKKFKVVHGFWAMPSGFFAVLIGKIYGIRSIVSILGGDTIALPEINYGQLIRWLPRKLIMWTLNHASDVISLTNHLSNNLRKFGLQRDDIKLIPWGVDAAVFTFRTKDLKVPIQFLHIANFHPVKDQETLLRAFKLISDNVPSRLTIIGEGVSANKVNALIKELNLENIVRILAPLRHEELPQHYHQANILLHTSLSEGQCVVVSEAMACGVLVCGTKVGLLYDLPESCVVVPVGDYESLAANTLKIIANPKEWNVLTTRAYDWVSKHSIQWTIERLKECYRYE